MHVIQSQLINYSYDGQPEKKIKFIRWWVLGDATGSASGEVALPFTHEQEAMFIDFMNKHLSNFPENKREIFNSESLAPPSLVYEDLESDIEKPCLLLIRAKGNKNIHGVCRRMDIVLQNDEIPVQLPFDLAGEIILEQV